MYSENRNDRDQVVSHMTPLTSFHVYVLLTRARGEHTEIELSSQGKVVFIRNECSVIDGLKELTHPEF